MDITPAQRIGIIGDAYPSPNRRIHDGRLYLDNDEESVDLDAADYKQAVGGVVLVALGGVTADLPVLSLLETMPTGLARDTAIIDAAEKIARGIVAAEADEDALNAALFNFGAFLIGARGLISMRVRTDD